ncbi:MAG: porin family protein [Bdellovibrionales bacterium]|nr:porin family protein [Bdellovibrionales bacterium]
MRNYVNTKCYLSLITILSLLVTTNLYALESKLLNDQVEFNKESNKQNAELANDSSYNHQPIIEVKSSAVEESEAGKMRKRREDAEMKTEQKIAESLERARLADEKKRAERIFGNKIQPANSAAPQQNTQPSRLDAIENSLSTIKTNLFNQDFDKIEQDSGKYVGLDLGTGKYAIQSGALAKDVTTRSIFGVSTGMRVEDNPFITLEGHFLFSKQEYENNNGITNRENRPFTQVNQYNAGLALKYDIIPFVITPRLGASIDYTFRQYSQAFTENSNNFNNRKLDTHSVEVALIAGGYIKVSKYLGIEVSYRQMTNVSTSARSNSYDPNSRNNNGNINDRVKLLDRSSYGMFLLSLQMGFR